jgi:hypothetical protein
VRASSGNEQDEDERLHEGRADRTFVHVADGATQLVGQHDQDQGGGDQLRDGAGGGDDACGEPHVVFVAQHHRKRDHAHRDDRCRHGARDCAEDRSDDDDREGEPAGHRAEQLAGAFEQILGEAAAFQDRAHQGEKGNGKQQFVRDDAVDAQRQAAKVFRWKEAEIDAQHPTGETEGGQRKCDRKPDEHHDDQAAEHERRHQFAGDHCSGFS